MATYWDIINRNDLTPEQKAQEIQAIGELERKQIDRENLGAKARIGLGATLQGVSALPVFNIPYIGTGLGGALFETGNAIMQGKTKEDIAKDAGTGFVVGETVGAIPYVGKVASKTKAGQAVGNQASKLFNYLTDTKVGQKVAEIAPKIEDVLMTDIKAFNPNKQTAYHGSPYDFVKFSNEAIGTGEGAQAHGIGHYVAKSKDVADKRYRKRLTTSSKEEVEIDNRYKPLFDEAEKKYDKLLNDLYKQKQDGKITEDFYQNAIDNSKEAIEVNNILASWQKEVASLKGKKLTPNEGQLYKLSIPKDDVMLREDLPLSQQPIKVQEALNKIGSYKTVTPATMYNGELYKHNPNGLFKGWFKANGGGKVNDELAEVLDNIGYTDEIVKMGNHFDGEMTGNQIYQKLNNDYHNNYTYMQGLKPSDLLNQHGIKGISYNGGIDGEARVIFNPDDIEIVRKYYNQPELFQKLTGQTPNTGAVASNLYEYLTNSKANKNFEKELNLLYNNPANIDPNTLKINIGGVSDKAFDLGVQNGYDLTDFSHIIDNSSFNHFRNRHFGENEIDKRLIPLNDIDIRNIPNIIYNPDSLEFLPATKRKKPRIKYSKLVDDGKQIYVEELQNKKKRLNTKTMWKEKN